MRSRRTFQSEFCMRQVKGCAWPKSEHTHHVWPMAIITISLSIPIDHTQCEVSSVPLHPRNCEITDQWWHDRCCSIHLQRLLSPFVMHWNCPCLTCHEWFYMSFSKCAGMHLALLRLVAAVSFCLSRASCLFLCLEHGPLVRAPVSLHALMQMTHHDFLQ